MLATEVVAVFAESWPPGLFRDEAKACNLALSFDMILFMPPVRLDRCAILKEAGFWGCCCLASKGYAAADVTRRIAGSRRLKDIIDNRSER
jgi:hypothetical protein